MGVLMGEPGPQVNRKALAVTRGLIDPGGLGVAGAFGPFAVRPVQARGGAEYRALDVASRRAVPRRRGYRSPTRGLDAVLVGACAAAMPIPLAAEFQGPF